MSNKRDRLDEEGLPLDELMSIVKDIVSSKKTSRDKQKYCKRTYPDFVDRYPMLFEKVCEDNFDMERFIYMMELKEKIQKREHTIESASVEVGQKLFDEYVKPIVDQNKDEK